MRSWLDWLCGKAARRQGYKNGYRSGLRAGKTESEAIIREARQTALKHFELTVEQARQEAQKLKAEAKQDGYASGERAGREKGYEAGREDGKRVAYRQLAERLGFVPDATPPTETELPELDMSGFRPNIYEMNGCYRVRVIVNGNRMQQDFRFERKRVKIQDPNVRYSRTITVWRPVPETQLPAMLKAIAFRNSLVDFSHRHQVLWDEICHEHTDYSSLQLAEEFHRRLQQSELSVEDVGFVGEDPEDRLEVEDTSLMLRPWTCLFDKIPHRVSNAFDALGIGSRDNPRTVRDMLLLTSEELLGVNDFGRVTLNKLQEGLREHGLALWGDDIPPPPRPEQRPGGREFRAIDLGFDDE